jgi:hypothetical protein
VFAVSKAVLVLLVIAVTGFPTEIETKCSPENSEKLIERLAIVMGELGNREMNISKIVNAKDNESKSLDDLKVRIRKALRSSTPEYQKAMNEIGPIVEQHPECDKKFLLRLKNK